MPNVERHEVIHVQFTPIDNAVHANRSRDRLRWWDCPGIKERQKTCRNTQNIRECFDIKFTF